MKDKLNSTQKKLRALWGAEQFEKNYFKLASHCRNKNLAMGLLDAIIISELMTSEERAEALNQKLDADPSERRKAINFIDGLRE